MMVSAYTNSMDLEAIDSPKAKRHLNLAYELEILPLIKVLLSIRLILKTGQKPSKSANWAK